MIASVGSTVSHASARGSVVRLRRRTINGTSVDVAESIDVGSGTMLKLTLAVLDVCIATMSENAHVNVYTPGDKFRLNCTLALGTSKTVSLTGSVGLSWK